MSFVAFVGFAVLAMFRHARAFPCIVPRYTGLIFMAVLLRCGMSSAPYISFGGRGRKYVLTVNGDDRSPVGPHRGGRLLTRRCATGYLAEHRGRALHPVATRGWRCICTPAHTSFVLGGRDRRIGPSTPLDAAPIQVVDARLPASDFDELLRLGGRAAARGPAPGEPTRCILFPNSQTIVNSGPFAFRKKQRLVNSLGREQLFIDVDNDTIRVVDPNLTRSTPLPQFPE